MNQKHLFNSRADLLRWYFKHQDDSKLAATACFAGYEYIESNTDVYIDQVVFKEPMVGLDEDITTANKVISPNSPPLEEFCYISHRKPHKSFNSKKERIDVEKSKPFLGGDIPSWDTSQPQLSHLPLLANSCISAFLKYIFNKQQLSKVDIPLLVKKLSELYPLSILPKKAKDIPVSQVVIIVDFSDQLLPFWEDFKELCVIIRHVYGNLGLEIRVLKDTPNGPYYELRDRKRRLIENVIPAPGSTILILSDLGQLCKNENIIKSNWIYYGELLNRQGLHPIVLAPISKSHQDKKLSNNYKQYIWSKNSPFRPNNTSISKDERRKKISRLLSLVSFAVHVEPELFRAIGYLLPIEDADSGLEAEVWLHTDVVWGYTSFSLRADKREKYQKLLLKEKQDLIKQVFYLIKQHHAHQFPSIWAEEIIQAKEFMVFSLEDKSEYAKAVEIMMRFTETFRNNLYELSMRQFVNRQLKRITVKTSTKHDFISTLYGLVNEKVLREGVMLIPDKYKSELVFDTISRSIDDKNYLLIQKGNRLFLSEEHLFSSRRGLLQGSQVAQLRLSEDIIFIENNKKQTSVVIKEDKPLLKVSFSNEKTELQTSHEKLVVSTMSKPDWAESIGRDHEGLYIETQDKKQKLYWKEPELKSESESIANRGVWYPSQYAYYTSKPFWANSIGRDQHGIYADFVIKDSIQRMRWIEPGSYYMGYLERNKTTDGINQDTKIYNGFWFADTACSQALWKTITGKNPSKFIHLNRPVEQVSWNEIQKLFFKNLKLSIPKLLVRLPTEEEWEYACRAGTTSQYNFKGEISLEKVNYLKLKEKPVSVSSMNLPNTWGLHEMHGNVWEWCQNTWQEDSSNIIGHKPNFRVVRGGAWNETSDNVRSESRSYRKENSKESNIGFRFIFDYVY